MIHLVGNAHIDAVWLWQWPDGYAEVLATFRSALDRLAEYPDFVFTCSSAAYYAWVEEHDPAMLDEIRCRVAEGRWRIAGGWWVEPDCNLPGGESFVRQGLLGQRTFLRLFGLRATVGYNVDSFGHHAMLPQILAKMGLKRYVFMRPGSEEKELPATSFWWESPDGSRVLTYRIPYAYTTADGSLADHIGRCAALVSEKEPELMCFYGVGNHGGGPTRAAIETIARLQRENASMELSMSSPEEFFASLEGRAEKLPVVRDELQHHSRGCYSVQSEIKRLNRAAETRLLNAEKFAVVASLLTGRTPAGELGRAWRNVLFNQFHDILAGTSIEPACEDAREQYGEALAIAARSINRSLQAIAWSIDIRPERATSKPLVVFNPHAFDVEELVEVEFFHEGQVGDSGMRPSDELVDETGSRLPFQLVQSHAALAGRSRIAFQADVPALGYRLYRVRTAPERPRPAPSDDALGFGSDWVENGELRIEVDRASGSLKRLFDKRLRIDLLAEPGCAAVVLRDRSDTWSHGIARFDERIGEFGSAKVRLVERGPVRAVIRSVSTYGASTLVQDFVLSARSPFIDVRVRLDWRERQCALKLRFPVAVEEARATYEIPFGTIVREANGAEEPGQSWIDLSGRLAGGAERYGLSLANTEKQGYSVEENTLSLTVARSPIYAHHLPVVPDPELDYRYTDQGEQAFAYRLVPHTGDWHDGATTRLAATLNNPLIAVPTTFHRGALPARLRFIRVDEPNVAVTALKRSEDNDDIILRCCELHGRETNVTIGIEPLGVELRGRLQPCEIKTFRIPREAPQRYREVDLLERPLEEPHERAPEGQQGKQRDRALETPPEERVDESHEQPHGGY